MGAVHYVYLAVAGGRVAYVGVGKLGNYYDRIDRHLRGHSLIAKRGLNADVFAMLALVRSAVYGHGDVKLSDVRDALVEELTDVFIYTLTIAGLLGIDLEKAYFEKLEKNRRRF
ncbi:hypothetical protein [Pyrobaculum sp.]|uniref:hypothetical protein n=1 Tax=Pyrobaculum sp. TaxID=2004705 RepID=UPI003D10D964